MVKDQSIACAVAHPDGHNDGTATFINKLRDDHGLNVENCLRSVVEPRTVADTIHRSLDIMHIRIM